MPVAEANAIETLLGRAKPPGPVGFAPPFVEVGWVVQWKSHPSDENPSAAIVTGTNGKSCDLLRISPGMHNGYPMDGVMHIDDPDLKRRQIENGCWQLTRRDQLIAELLSKK
jgi:hypothetical protein